jgi:hypothetical protein
MSSVKRITKRVVELASPGPSEFFVWDTELRGFGVRILPSGVRTYFVQYRMPAGSSAESRLAGMVRLLPMKPGGRHGNFWPLLSAATILLAWCSRHA